MIKLEHINTTNDLISCTAFVEDCTEPIQISVNKISQEMVSSPLPENYEWCRTHLIYAKRALLAMIENGEIETSTMIMWY